MTLQLPGEDETYRKARAELLDAERSLRREVERVAALRRTLPPGGAIPTDYRFDERDTTGGTREVALSELFTLPGKSLVLYSFMYAEGATPCPMCTSFLDSLNGVARHVRGQMNLAIVARGSIGQVTNWADERGWSERPPRMGGPCAPSRRHRRTRRHAHPKQTRDRTPPCHAR